jgi:hypothetical protein
MYSSVDEIQAGQEHSTSNPCGHRRESSNLPEEADLFAPPALSIQIHQASNLTSRQPSFAINSPTFEGDQLMPPKQRASCLAQVWICRFSY